MSPQEGPCLSPLLTHHLRDLALWLGSSYTASAHCKMGSPPPSSPTSYRAYTEVTGIIYAKTHTIDWDKEARPSSGRIAEVHNSAKGHR